MAELNNKMKKDLYRHEAAGMPCALSSSEFAGQLRDMVRSEKAMRFSQPVAVQTDWDERINCRSFREYANTMQHPDPTRVHIPEETERLLTLLVNTGQITPLQANGLHGEYTFDEDGREALYWPEPEEAAARLGLPELAAAFRADSPAQEWGQQM